MLFYIAFAIYCLMQVSDRIAPNKEMFNVVWRVFHTTFFYHVLFLTKILFFQKYEKTNILITAMCSVVAILAYISSGEYCSTIALIIMILAAQGISVISCSCIATVTLTSMLIWRSMTYLYEGMIVTNSGIWRGKVRYELIGKNTNVIAFYFAIIIFGIIVSRRGKIKWVDVIIILLLVGINVVFTRSMTFNVVMFSLALALTCGKCLKEQLCKVAGVYNGIAMVANVAIYLLCQIDITKYNGWEYLHAVTSNRIVSSHKVLQYYDIGLLGQKVDLNMIHDMEGYQFAYLDPQLCYMMLSFGVIFTILWYIFFIAVIVKNIANHNFTMACVLGAMMLYGTMENMIGTDILYCPMILGANYLISSNSANLD